jgi:hypothetical protein
VLERQETKATAAMIAMPAYAGICFLDVMFFPLRVAQAEFLQFDYPCPP